MADSKPVKQEVSSTVKIPNSSIPWIACLCKLSERFTSKQGYSLKVSSNYEFVELMIRLIRGGQPSSQTVGSGERVI
jgi:hypothetical protein